MEPARRPTLIEDGNICSLFLGVVLLLSSIAAASHELEEVSVTGRNFNLVGEAASSSEGLVGQSDISIRPMLRTGEIIELVPGMAATQHSGSGKANQYFLRGFNLDHGTDFAMFIDHMPVNMRTHGHGQGYADLNFLIPEVIDHLAYRKGPYYADVGDFSGAGNAHFTTRTSMESGVLRLKGGKDGYLQLMTAGSVEAAGGEFLYALESQYYDGPWTDIHEDVEKYNTLLKYSHPVGDSRLAITFMGYDNEWNSADQIPRRAVISGQINDLGSIDTTLGGYSSRYSLSAAWEAKHWSMSVYAIDYDLQLWSNFTYFLDDPINGDQFQQDDHRRIYGGTARYDWEGSVDGHRMINTFGMDTRLDVIEEIGLYQTVARRRLGTIRNDETDQFSAAVYWQNEFHWTDNLRSTLGARYDHYEFDVEPRITLNVHDIDISANRGRRDDGILNLKGSLAWVLNRNWEVYAAAGQGFHSNDARGTVTHIDPVDGSPVTPVDPLVRSRGMELGLRAHWPDQLNASLALWTLELDSELLFVGDAGNTEASRRSIRRGIEATAYYRFNDRWTLDLEYAWTDAQFSGTGPASGDHIPGAVEEVLQAGLSVRYPGGWHGSLRLRHIGPRPLTGDNSVRSDSSTVINLLAGYQWNRFSIRAEVLNLFDSNDHDIDYNYTSRLPGEPATGITDRHYHIMEPRTFRLSLSLNY